ASLKNAQAVVEPLPDFSKAPPVVSIAKVAKHTIDDATWDARSARLSGVFAAYPEILSSGVELQLLEGTTSLMNSEGTAVRYDDGLYWVYGKAEGQASDGMLLHDAVSVQSLELDKF